jgi:hypothetical protein
MYSPTETRTPQLLAISAALKMALQERLPIDSTGKVVPVIVKATETSVTNALDDVEFQEFVAPSIVIGQPSFISTNDVRSNRPLYRDFDYAHLTVKEFPEPIHGKFRFSIHTIANNPDNDLILLTFLLRCKRTLCEINAKISPDSQEYDRIVLFWQQPTEYDSEDGTKVRVFNVDANTHLEVLEFSTRKLIDSEDPLDFTVGDYGRVFGRQLVLSQTASESSTIVYVTGTTVGLPLSGVGMFEDETTFNYTGKTYNSFTGVSGIVGYHFYDEKIVIRW